MYYLLPQSIKAHSKAEESKMNFDWESEEEKLLRYMKIPAHKKMEWLRQMHEFIVKTSSKQTLALRQKLREIR